MNRESERKRLVELIENFFEKEIGASFVKGFLDKFADNILDDGWMRPPVKVGQKVYIITEISKTITEVAVIGVWQCVSSTSIITEVGTIHQDSFGNAVFTSREDALKALEGSGENV